MIDKKLNFKNLLEKYKDNPALIWPGGKLTYHQYIQYINHVSIILKKKGVKSGRKVAILSDIHHYFPILFFAVLVAGGIVVPINPKIPTEKIHSLIKENDCILIISLIPNKWAPGPVVPIFNKSFSPDPTKPIPFISGNALVDKVSGVQKLENISSLNFEKEATIVFTSGTQGMPRGVLHSIGNHYYSAVGSNQNITLNQNDCWMITLPFYHIAAIAILFRTLIVGAACFVPDTANDFLNHFKSHNVTHLSLVSTQLHRWIRDYKVIDSARTLKAILLGGGQISPILIKQALQQKLPVFTSYGSTEMSSQITTTSGQDLAINPASSGKILSFCEIMIDKTGEILVRGRTLGQGYVSKDDTIKFVDEDGWFRTGDLGYFDDDENLVVTGRRDNMFISGGENIHPEEIERHLLSMKNIAEVCVIDVPDAEYGARSVAFIKVDESHENDETQIKKYLQDKIAGFKIPVKFFLWPEETANLKPDRNYFRELAISLVLSDFK
jgi:O-succinylbenzoic acid--CoA ligase